MAKITARGCYELARWKGPEKEEEQGSTYTKRYLAVFRDTIVLRSDGVALIKSDCRHKPGERWSMGTYTTHGRLSLVRKGEKWAKLDGEERDRRMACLRQCLENRGYTEVRTIV